MNATIPFTGSCDAKSAPFTVAHGPIRSPATATGGAVNTTRGLPPAAPSVPPTPRKSIAPPDRRCHGAARDAIGVEQDLDRQRGRSRQTDEHDEANNQTSMFQPMAQHRRHFARSRPLVGGQTTDDCMDMAPQAVATTIAGSQDQHGKAPNPITSTRGNPGAKRDRVTVPHRP